MSQKRYAYLIGANGPETMRLKYAESDVERLADTFRGPVCQFSEARVAIAHSRKDSLAGFKQFAEQCELSDVLLVHFSGHAVFDEQLYLLCNDTDINELDTTALEINTIKKIMRKSRSRYKLLILDCCHAAGAHNNPLKGEQDMQLIVHETVQGSASVILSACSRKAQTRELEHLDGGSGFLSWAVRATCTKYLHEVASGSERNAISLDDLWRRGIPKALAYVNETISRGYPLPKPMLLSEQESGDGSEIWLTPPPSSRSEPLIVEQEEDRRKYLEQVYKRYSSVTLPIGPAEGFSLHAVFQPLVLRRDPLAAEDLERKDRRTLLGEPQKDEWEYGYSALEKLKDEHPNKARHPEEPMTAENGEDALKKSPQRRVMILGSPGTGKTTTLKHLVSCRVKEALTHPDVPLPIFLSLPDLARSGKTLQRYLVDIVEDMGAHKRYAEVLWKELESGHAFVALDSLDEIDPSQRSRIIYLINRWTSEKGNTWLVSSRFTEYKGGQFKHGQFAEWELLSMTPQIRRDLATKLLPVLQSLLTSEATSIPSPANFVTLLENHSQAAAWGENPLLFSLAAVVFVKTGGLPSSRAILYRDVIEAVLIMREPDSVASKHLLRTLMSLALWLHQIKGRTFTKDDLLTFLEDVQHRGWEETEVITKKVITSGILDVVAHDTFGFRHQTFQEYLAAAELAKRFTNQDAQVRAEAWTFAWNKRTYSRWIEVLRLMAGILAQLPGRKGHSEAVRWLRQLVDQRSTEEGDPGDLGLALSLRSLVEVTDMVDWETEKTDQLENHVVSLWLQELLDAARSQRKTRLERFQKLAEDVAHLRGKRKEIIIEKLIKALKDRDIEVQRVAANTFVALWMWIPTRRLRAMLEDPNDGVRRVAVKALGSRGKHVPLEFFIAMLKDPDEDVREATIEVLNFQNLDGPLDPLLAMLEDPSRKVQQATTLALHFLSTRMSLGVLLAMLENPNGKVRAAAIRALGSQVEHIPLDSFLSVLKDPDDNVRMAAVEAVGSQGKRVSLPLDPLLAMLKDPNEHVRRAAVEALGSQDERVPLESLLTMLKDPNESVRRAVIRVLGSQGERVPLESLLTMFKDPYGSVRMAAVEAVGSQGKRLSLPLDPLLAMLEDPYDGVRMVAVEALGSQGKLIPLDPLLAMLEDPNEHVRRATVEALGSQGKLIPLDPLLAMLENPNDGVRRVAVEVLGSQDERVPLESLLAMLKDPNESVRRAAIRVLGSQGERVPLESLLAMLKDPNGNVRAAAIQVLGTQHKRVPLESLLIMLENPSWSVRRAAIQVLGTQHKRVPLESLLAMLEDPDKDVRQAAIQALGAQSKLMPLEVLLALLEKPNGNVRAAAVQVIGSQSEHVSLEILLALLKDSSWRVRRATVEVLGFQSKCVPLESLLTMLEDPNESVRLVARQVVEKWGEAVPIARLTFMHGNKDENLRKTMIKTFKRQKEQIHVTDLLSLLYNKDKNTRLAAIQALEAQEESLSPEPFIELLSDEDKDVRYAAIQILQKQAPHILAEISAQALLVLQGDVSDSAFKPLAHIYVINILSELNNTSTASLEKLTELLDYPHWQVRMKAAQALGKLLRNIPDVAIKRLLELRRDPNPRMHAVREAADDALAEILSLETGIEDE